MRFLTKINHYICTLYIFLVLYLLALIPAQFELLDPVGKALSDFELTDLVFSKLRHDPSPDTNVVLINIGTLSRQGIARQISEINKHQPKIIAIDAFFRSKKDFDQDISLIMALSQVKNLVMVSDLYDPNKKGNCFSSLKTSHPQFNQFAINGFAEMKTSSEGFRTVRDFVPQFCVGDSNATSFAGEIVKIYDKDAYTDLLKRNNSMETINWLGDNSKFFRLDAKEVLSGEIDLSFVKDKIVLLGFLGSNYLGEKSLEDTFFTPLNSIPAGRANPDMYGVTIHANIISMILRRDYIQTIPFTLNALIAFILVFLNVSLFMWVGNNYKVYYDLITKVLILIEVALLFAINIFTLLNFNLKADLTLAIVAIIFSGDLTELYVGSLKDIGLMFLDKIKPFFKRKQATE